MISLELNQPTALTTLLTVTGLCIDTDEAMQALRTGRVMVQGPDNPYPRACTNETRVIDPATECPCRINILGSAEIVEARRELLVPDHSDPVTPTDLILNALKERLTIHADFTRWNYGILNELKIELHLDGEKFAETTVTVEPDLNPDHDY